MTSKRLDHDRVTTYLTTTKDALNRAINAHLADSPVLKRDEISKLRGAISMIDSLQKNLPTFVVPDPPAPTPRTRKT